MKYKANDISVLIPTINRPHQLKECLDSIQRQTKPPMEVVVVDASEDLESKVIIENSNYTAFLIQYYRSRPSKIDQRNFGAQQAKGKLIQLSDDDIVFDDHYFERVEEYLFALTDEKFGGYIGSIFESGMQNEKTDSINLNQKLSMLFQKMFFIYPIGKGKMLKSGQHQLIRNVISGDNSIKIDIMGGAGCYLKEVFNEILFDSFFKGYAAGEDLDFSLRVSLKYNLYYFPKALFFHNHIGNSSRSIADMMFDKTKLLRLFFFRYKKMYHLSWPHHLWALFGLSIFSLLFKKNWPAFRATIKGMQFQSLEKQYRNL